MYATPFNAKAMFGEKDASTIVVTENNRVILFHGLDYTYLSRPTIAGHTGLIFLSIAAVHSPHRRRTLADLDRGPWSMFAIGASQA